MKILFNNQQHLDRFLAAIQRISKVYQGGKIDCYYGSALYILADDEWTMKKAKSYISAHGIDFEGMLKNVDFSGAYSVLIQFACSVFNGNVDVDFEEFMRLDENNFQLALTALQFRYYGAIHAIRLGDLEVR